MKPMKFSICFNKNEYNTEENFNILESVKGVEKSENEVFGEHAITFNNFEEMEAFCLDFEKKTDYNATTIITFDNPCLFIEMNREDL